MHRVAAFSLVALALAACKPAVDEGRERQKQEQVRASEVKQLRGWERAFQPDVAVGAANQFGFRAPAYAAAAGSFASVGATNPITDAPAGKKPNTVGFEAKGAAADRVDTIAFRLDLADAPRGEPARKRFAAIVRDYLFQSKIDAAALHDKLTNGEAAKGQLDGIDYRIDSAPTGATVTFYRTGASAPANS